MSLIETITEFNIDVDSQYEKKYAAISSNQCSWCAYEFANNAQEFRKLWLKKDFDKFTELYNKCILNGSNYRKDCNKYTCGENIDDDNIIKQYNNISIIDKCVTILNESNKDIINILPSELKNVFFIRDDIPQKDLNFLKMRIDTNKFKNFIIVNRFGQSFTIIPLYNSKYIIMDSHCRKCGITNIEGIINYLTINNDTGYNLILWIHGY